MPNHMIGSLYLSVQILKYRTGDSLSKIIGNQQVTKCAFVTWQCGTEAVENLPQRKHYYLEKFIELLFIRFY